MENRDQGELLFFINLEVPDGKMDRLEFHARDSPEELAFNYCRKRGLSMKVYNLIVNSLTLKIQELTRKGRIAPLPPPLPPNATPHKDMFHLQSSIQTEPSLSLETQNRSVAFGGGLHQVSMQSKSTTNQPTDGRISASIVRYRHVDRHQMSPPRQGASTSAEKIAGKGGSNLKASEKAQRENIPPLDLKGDGNTKYEQILSSPSGKYTLKQMSPQLKQLSPSDLRGGSLSSRKSHSPQRPNKTKPLHASSSPDTDLFLNPNAAFILQKQTQPQPLTSSQGLLTPKKPGQTPDKTQQRTHSKSPVPGVRLYQDGIANYIKKVTHVEHTKKMKEEVELAQASFVPEINRISQLLCETKAEDIPVHDRLSRFGQNSNLKRQRLRELKEEIQESTFDFKPQINLISQIINEERDKTLNAAGVKRYEQLYEDGMHKAVARSISPLKEVNPNCTFQPQINEKSKLLSAKDKKDFLKRVESSIEKKQTLLSKHFEANDKSKSKSPLKRPVNRDACLDLFYNGQNHSQLMQTLEKEHIDKIKQDCESSKMTASSKHIVDKVENKMIGNIFYMLDVYQNGRISKENWPFAVDRFEPRAQRMLNQFFEVIGKADAFLDLDGFVANFRKFMRQALSIEEQRYILAQGDSKHSRKPQHKQYSFQVVISLT